MREPLYSNLFMLRSLSSTYRDQPPTDGRGGDEGPGAAPAGRGTARWDVEVLLVVLFAAAAIVCEVLYKGGV